MTAVMTVWTCVDRRKLQFLRGCLRRQGNTGTFEGGTGDYTTGSWLSAFSYVVESTFMASWMSIVWPFTIVNLLFLLRGQITNTKGRWG